MMKALVLAEKPSVGKDIARVLSCKKGGNGFLEGDKYIVTWAMGHLVTLADPERYNPKYKAWDINDLPIMPDKMKLEVIGKTSKQFNTIKELLGRRDVNEVIIATDAGREGELVARLILEKVHCDKNVKRLWISSVTDKAIRDGFARLRDGRSYVNLYYSAQARAEADWLVGINATRCLTTKHNSQLSCGRVQTPTVAIIEKREREIRSFVPKKFVGLTASTEKFQMSWQDGKTKEYRTFDLARGQELFAVLNNERKAVVTEVTKIAKKSYPPKLYDLTELQRDANKRYGMSPKATLSVMQKLYEQHKALTYPRTDSRYLSSDIVDTIPERLRACAHGQFAKTCMRLAQSKIKADSNFVDNSKVSDHHAIIPTEQSVDPRDFSADERKIYDLVVMRFLSVLLPPFEYEQTTIKARIGNETFVATGKVTIRAGFKDVFFSEDDEEDGGLKEQSLPRLEKGDMLAITGVKLTEGKTSPPAPFNEATLLSAMENPAKFMDVDDKTIARTLGETGGLGTVATRADIIEKLFDSFLIEKKGRDIFTTSKGRQLLQLAPVGLQSPELTGQWEQKLSGIAEGKLKKEEFLAEIRAYTREIITEIKQSAQVFRHDNITNTKCSECGKFMLEVQGKKGKMLVCQDRECGYRKSVSISIRSRCPHCHKMLELVGEGDKRKIVCSCGFSEKYETFEKRKAAERNVPSKRDLQKHIERINNNDEGKNNPMAEALKNFKF